MSQPTEISDIIHLLGVNSFRGTSTSPRLESLLQIILPPSVLLSEFLKETSDTFTILYFEIPDILKHRAELGSSEQERIIEDFMELLIQKYHPAHKVIRMGYVSFVVIVQSPREMEELVFRVPVLQKTAEFVLESQVKKSPEVLATFLHTVLFVER